VIKEEDEREKGTGERSRETDKYKALLCDGTKSMGLKG